MVYPPMEGRQRRKEGRKKEGKKGKKVKFDFF
jgi:hypothetical protein